MEEMGYAATVVSTPMLRGLMSAAYWSGLTRPQAEYLICQAAQATFVDSALTVIAASIDDLKFVPPANGKIGRWALHHSKLVQSKYISQIVSICAVGT